MRILLKTDIERGDAWQKAFAEQAPDIDAVNWPFDGDPASIDYAAVWNMPSDEWARYKNLKAIFSMGAGIDHLASDPKRPKHLPVVRLVEPGLTAGMTEFAVWSVLSHHRFIPEYTRQRQARLWQGHVQIAPYDRRVGIMGLGVLGSDAAQKLAPFGFDLAGWSRSSKELTGVKSYHGAEQLPAFLQRTEILLCLLPLTDETRGILNARTFAQLPKGAAVINLARGEHLVEKDLLAALDSDHLSGATLDVFEQEPLPQDSPIWDHPKVQMTPHVASMLIVDSTVRFFVDNIRRFEQGGDLSPIVDFERGY